MSIALSDATLDALPDDVARSGGDRAAVTEGIVHLGLGAFARAHQMPVIDDLIAQGRRDCGVVAVAMRNAALADALDRQDGLYTLAAGDAPLRVIGAIRRTLVAAREPAAVVAAIAQATVHSVTLTITEKGYADRGTGSAPDLLARGLIARRAAGAPPPTILSCDNMPGNGAVLRAAVLAVVDADAATRAWIADAVAWPSAMVDRITPRMTEASRREIVARLGLGDAAPVRCEAFSQWVLEDRFAPGAPWADAAGVDVMADVAPWERVKLRMLNGAHSTIAYAGLAHGKPSVAEAFAEPGIAMLVERVWDELATTISAPGIDLASYRLSLRRRFGDPAVPHRLAQIAEDGSAKLPQRLIAPWAERMAAGSRSPAIVAALNGWKDFVTETARRDPEALKDPRRGDLIAAVADARPWCGLLPILGVSGGSQPAMLSALEA